MTDSPTPSSPAAAPADLAMIQRWFQAVITHPQGISEGIASPDAQAMAPLSRSQLEAMITPSQQRTAEQRISIYAHAYFARLIECLSETFPMLRHVVGDDAFAGLAFGYLQQFPSRSYTLHELGRHFVPYLAHTRPPRPIDTAEPTADWADFLVDLATLEWTIDEVFDGPGIERNAPFDGDALAKLTADRWITSRLQLAPCVRLLAFRFPINAFFSQMRSAFAADAAEETALPSAPAPQPTWMLVTRRDYIVRRLDLTATQHALLTALQRGNPIAQAIEHASTFCNESDETLANSLRTWFTQWMSLGLFTSIEA